VTAERRFRAMGTDVHLIVAGPDGLVDDAVRRIEDLEARWSRFRPGSEVSRLNDAPEVALEVSPETALLVTRGIDAWRLSAGFVDCTQLAAVVAAGYDRSFDRLPADRPAGPAGPRVFALTGPADIVVAGTSVLLPPGVGFDPGGIGKGLAADMVTTELIAAGAEGVCVNLGGDLRVWGDAPGAEAWTVSVDHPWSRDPVALLGLTDGAVATSTTLRRTWTVDGQPRHHLIDPRTGEPSTSEWALVTVVAAEAWVAETLAKAVLLRGGDHPFDLVDGTGAEAIAVGHDGSVRASAGMAQFLGGASLPSAISEDGS
jgi:FAD:protein FMN transferase